MVDRLGQQLGNYRLTRLLGRGGFAEVYLGEHIRLNTQAAIKVLHTQLADQEVEGFQKEAQTIAHLEHPGIVRVLDFDVVNGLPFLVMSYAPNGTLRQRHSKGALLPLETIIPYIEQIADALQYAHDEKLIHRDIKPENMLVGRRNEILLSDFGIATMAQNSQYQSTQNIVGTVIYMAPEQIQGKPRLASDQYALGVVVYEWLSGSRPFQGSFTEVATQHVLMPPPPLRDRMPNISPMLEEVIMTALEKDPHKRFASVKAFGNALKQASRENTAHPVISLISTQLSLSKNLPVVSEAETPPEVASGEPSTSLPVASEPLPRKTLQIGDILCIYQGHSDVVEAIAWSPDGGYIASASDDGTVQVWDATTANHFLTYRGHVGYVSAVAWSPDGSRIASAGNDQTVQVWNATNGQHLFTYRGHTDSIWSIVWSPEGDCIASVSNDQTLRVWEALSGDEIFIYRDNESCAWTVAWSSDDKYLAFVHKTKLIQVCDPIEGRKVRIYRGHAGRVCSIAWSPDSKYLASGGEDQTILVWTADKGRKKLTCVGHTDSVMALVWSPDGTYIASGSEDQTVRIWDANTGMSTFIYSGHIDNVYTVDWSPDGQYIASSGSESTVQVWVAPS